MRLDEVYDTLKSRFPLKKTAHPSTYFGPFQALDFLKFLRGIYV